MAEIGKPPVRTVGLWPTLTARTPVLRWIARMRPGSRARLGISCVAAAALLFPLVHRNDADIDSIANALSFAALALGLNIVVGFAGLLDLGYAAFFAIGAYAYGILSSWQLQPEWTSFWGPFQWLGLVARNHTTAGDFVHFQVSFWLMLPGSAAIAALCGALFGAPTLRLKGDYLAIVTLGFGEIVPIVVRNWPSLTNGAMGLNGVAPPRLFGFDFGVSATPYYYVGVALVALLILIEPAPQGFAHRPRLDGDPRGRDRRRGDGRRFGSNEVARLCHRRRLRRARPARSTSPSCRPRHRTCSCFRYRSWSSS